MKTKQQYRVIKLVFNAETKSSAETVVLARGSKSDADYLARKLNGKNDLKDGSEIVSYAVKPID